MRVSAKTEYACIAMLELAAGYPSGQPVRIGSIAERHQIPSRFLVQILLQLKSAGFVVSTRGAAGGYALSRPPTEISLGQVMAVIEGAREGVPASSVAPSPLAQALHHSWSEAARAQQQRLDDVTLSDLLERARTQGEAMYYI